MIEFIHEVKFLPSYDHREDSRSRGAAGMRIHFILRSPEGVLTYEVLSDWMARPLLEPFDWARPKPWARAASPGVDENMPVRGPIGGTLTLHCPVKRVEWWLGPDPCDVLPGGQCYGNYGYLAGEPVLAALVSEGSDGLWREMTDTYHAWMEDR